MKAIFKRDICTALIHVEKKSTNIERVRIFANTNKFIEKKELHITLIGFNSGEKLQKIINSFEETVKNQVLEIIEQTIINTEWKPIYTNKFFAVQKEYRFIDNKTKKEVISVRDSIIEEIILPEIEVLYDSLNEILNADLQTQFPHITLFTKGDEKSKMGISINSKDEFERLNTTPIKN